LEQFKKYGTLSGTGVKPPGIMEQMGSLAENIRKTMEYGAGRFEVK
jgi:hypothetical protein